MVRRNCNVYLEVSKRKGKFSISPKLMILPAFHIIINSHTGVKLSDDIISVSIREFLISTSCTIGDVVVYRIPPFDLKNKLLSRLQRFVHFYTHHGLIDGVGKVSSLFIFYMNNVKPTIEGR